MSFVVTVISNVKKRQIVVNAMDPDSPTRRRGLIKLVLVHYLFLQLLFLPPQIIKLVTECKKKVKFAIILVIINSALCHNVSVH